MRTESFLISFHMTHQDDPLFVKLNHFRKKKVLVGANSSMSNSVQRRKADVLNTIHFYGRLNTVICTDGSAEERTQCLGSAAVMTTGDPGKPSFSEARHQYGLEIWARDGAVAAGDIAQLFGT
jgi:hypothetical protein